MEQFKSWEEMTDLEQAQCTYWDMYKDAYGYRPRGVDTSTWTLTDFEQEFASLGSERFLISRIVFPHFLSEVVGRFQNSVTKTPQKIFVMTL